jgi:hypothetical protein
MTEPSDPNSELDRAIARLVHDAGADAPQPPDIPALERPTEPTSSDAPRRRLAMAGALMLIVGAVAGVLYVTARDGGGSTVQPVDTSPTDTDGAIATSPLPTSAPPASSAPTSTESPTPSTSVEAGPATAEIRRPVTDPAACDPVLAREVNAEGLTLFARSSSNPIPIQVVADPVDGPVAPFAIVQRFFGDDRRPTGEEAVDIDGTTFWIRLTDEGNGVAEWDVGDGSLGYVRSRGLDRGALLDLLGALEPRAATASIPGFEFAPGTGGRELLHEQMNTDVAGEVGSSECAVASTGYLYRISALNGDPVLQYGGVIDRPVPLHVGTSGSTVIVIGGVADPDAPSVADVVEADPDFWLELRSRPQWDEQDTGRTEPIREGFDVVVPLDSVDGSTPQSYLTLRLVPREGVAFLEVDTADAVLAPDAAFWRTTIDPGNDGVTTASVGPVMGLRIGDVAPGEPIEVTVSVIDGGEFVLQSTGMITLIPS